jgi:hypothetical protein
LGFPWAFLFLKLNLGPGPIQPCNHPGALGALWINTQVLSELLLPGILFQFPAAEPTNQKCLPYLEFCLLFIK